jgi:hypothetical protein
LATLDISNNTRLGPVDYTADPYLDISCMPTLEEVFVWTMPFPPEGFKIDTTGSPNVYFTMECSR